MDIIEVVVFLQEEDRPLEEIIIIPTDYFLHYISSPVDADVHERLLLVMCIYHCPLLIEFHRFM